MLQGVVDGGNSALILFVVADAVGQADAVGALHAELGFKGTHELAEEVDDVAGNYFVEASHDFGLNEGREDDGPQTVLFLNGIDAARRINGFLHRVDEGNARLVIVQIRELREDRMRKRFGGNGRSVAHDEYLTGLLGFLRIEFLICHVESSWHFRKRRGRPKD